MTSMKAPGHHGPEDKAVLYAMRDSFVDDERALWNITDLQLAKRIVLAARCQLDLRQIIDRLQYSPLADELLPYALESYGITSSTEMLPAAHMMVSVNYGSLDPVFTEHAIMVFADMFWARRVLELVDDGSLQRAWRLLKVGTMGETALSDTSCYDYVLPGEVEGEPVGLVTSIQGAHHIVREFYARLELKGLVGDLLTEQVAPAGFTSPMPPGMPLVRILDGFSDSNAADNSARPNAIGVKLLAIGRVVHDPRRIAAEREAATRLLVDA